MRRLPARELGRIAASLDAMRTDPRAGDVKRVQGPAAEWRRRVGDYRIRYTLDTEARLVRVLPRGGANKP